VVETTAGSIYDVGYQRYEGVRLGRPHAIWALYVHSLRGVFGISRSLGSKIGPIGLAVIAFLPALVQLAVASIAPADIEVIRPEEYYNIIEVVLAVFCAVVAPELVGRDQRTQTLSLYFSRALRREDYALAKFAALVTGMLAITVIPQALMFVGNGLAGDFGDYLRDNWTDLPSILGSAVLLSTLIAAIGLAIAAQTPRRAYSTVGILAAFVVTSGVATAVFEAADQDVGRFALLLSPLHVVQGFSYWFFGAAFDPDLRQHAEADLPGVMYAITAALVTVVMLVLLLRRYQKIST
jgi:ABC-2 type transport system permease protein